MGYLVFDEASVTEVIGAVDAAERHARQLTRGLARALDAAGAGLVTPNAALVPAQLAQFAAWCTTTRADLQRRAGYLRAVRADAQLFPTDRVFRTVSEARSAGMADGRALVEVLRASRAGSCAGDHLVDQVRALTARATDATWCETLAAVFTGDDLQALAQLARARYAGPQGVIDAAGRQLFRQELGVLMDAVFRETGDPKALQRWRDLLTVSTEDFAVLATGAHGIPLEFLVGAARAVLGAREPYPDEVVLRTRIQLTWAISADPRVCRRLVTDGASWRNLLALTTIPETWTGLVDPAGAAVQALLEAALAWDQMDVTALGAAWSVVIFCFGRHPELADRRQGNRGPVLQAIASRIGVVLPYFASLTGPVVEDSGLARFGWSVPAGQLRLAADTRLGQEFCATLLADPVARIEVMRALVAYVSGLHLERSLPVMPGVGVVLLPDLTDKADLVLGALTTVIGGQHLARARYEELVELHASMLEALLEHLGGKLAGMVPGSALVKAAAEPAAGQVVAWGIEQFRAWQMAGAPRTAEELRRRVVQMLREMIFLHSEALTTSSSNRASVRRELQMVLDQRLPAAEGLVPS